MTVSYKEEEGVFDRPLCFLPLFERQNRQLSENCHSNMSLDSYSEADIRALFGRLRQGLATSSAASAGTVESVVVPTTTPLSRIEAAELSSTSMSSTGGSGTEAAPTTLVPLRSETTVSWSRLSSTRAVSRADPEEVSYRDSDGMDVMEGLEFWIGGGVVVLAVLGLLVVACTSSPRLRASILGQ